MKGQLFAPEQCTTGKERCFSRKPELTKGNDAYSLFSVVSWSQRVTHSRDTSELVSNDRAQSDIINE